MPTGQPYEAKIESIGGVRNGKITLKSEENKFTCKVDPKTHQLLLYAPCNIL